MRDDLVNKIRQFGHWRVNFRPTRELPEPLTFQNCREIVEKSAVSIRGWDFPHINRKNDDEGGYETVGSYVQNWTDWWGFFEFWRMYKSSQFLAYLALREDTRPDEHGNPSIPILNTTGTIYSITEFVEFLHRLNSHQLYQNGAEFYLELRNTNGRILTAGQHRIPFFERYTNNGDVIRLVRRLRPQQLAEDHRSLAIELCLEMFDNFGWNPARSHIESEIERFYKREWSY
jgi:hypothetical protein